MKKQVLSIEQMQTLIDKGIDVSWASMFYKIGIWTGMDYDHTLLPVSDKEPFKPRRKDLPTFDLSDILEVLPKVLNGAPLSIQYFMDGICHISYKDICGFRSYNALQSAYQMLLWCIDNNHIKTK